MLVARSLESGYLSNAYIVGDEDGGTAVYVDSGAPLEPLLAFAPSTRSRSTHVLRTHSHGDHVVHEHELGVPVVMGPLTAGRLVVEAIPTPGHSDDMICFVITDDGDGGRSCSRATPSSRTPSAEATSARSRAQ